MPSMHTWSYEQGYSGDSLNMAAHTITCRQKGRGVTLVGHVTADSTGSVQMQQSLGLYVLKYVKWSF